MHPSKIGMRYQPHRQYVSRLTMRAMVLLPLLCIVLLLQPPLVVGRRGLLSPRAAPRLFQGRRRRPSTTSYLPDFVTITTTSSYDLSSPSRRTRTSESSTGVGTTANFSTTSDSKVLPRGASTKVADLAKEFEHAISAVNQDKKEIHVGRLLSACERLGDTMNDIGFSQSARDIKGNIRKIRSVYDRLPASERESMVSILEYERMASGVHHHQHVRGGGVGETAQRLRPSPAVPLQENSATMGFLWLGRSLNYQYDMFHHMLHGNEEPYEAARLAYEKDLKPHLSWTVQKVCQAAMTSLKPLRRETILSRVGGFEEECYGDVQVAATERDLSKVMETWDPMLVRWRQIFSELELDEL